MRLDMSLICRVVGHKTKGQPVRPVGSSRGTKMHDEFGKPLDWPIAFHMRVCKICGRHQPISEDDARRQRELNDYINEAMNGSRRQYGLGWLDFSNGP